MTKRRVSINQDPHYDGDREGIISDSVGKQVGIQSNTNKESNPFGVKSLKKDSKMEKFSQTMEDY